MKSGRIYIGTSGWEYKHWNGIFYPKNLPLKEHFNYYCERFDTVEINNSFYKLPAIKTFSAWRKSAPKDFLFAVKASRFITHMKKLTTTKQSHSKFFNRAERLEHKLGPVLFQLPPRWKSNIDRLKHFLAKLPGHLRYTFEFREQSWYNKEVYQLLRDHNCAFCIYELEQHLSPLQVTADFIYIRLHGPGNKYQGSYRDSQLKKWAKFCLQWQRKGKDIFVYFDNDQEAYAVFNALSLKTFVQGMSK